MRRWPFSSVDGCLFDDDGWGGPSGGRRHQEAGGDRPLEPGPVARRLGRCGDLGVRGGLQVIRVGVLDAPQQVVGPRQIEAGDDAELFAVLGHAVPRAREEQAAPRRLLVEDQVQALPLAIERSLEVGACGGGQLVVVRRVVQVEAGVAPAARHPRDDGGLIAAQGLAGPPQVIAGLGAGDLLVDGSHGAAPERKAGNNQKCAIHHFLHFGSTLFCRPYTTKQAFCQGGKRKYWLK